MRARVIRLLLLVALATALATVGALLADRPGTVTWQWLGSSGTLSTTAALVLACTFALAVVGLVELWRSLRSAPWRSTTGRSRRERLHAAHEDGVLAVAVGDLARARREQRRAHRLDPDAPLSRLLAAQVAQMAGDSTRARAEFETLAGASETRTLGLRGLSMEAARAGDTAAQRAYARAAHAADPSLAWASAAAFHAACAERDFEGALALNETMVSAGHLERAAYKRRRAVLLTAMAAAAPEAANARGRAQEAHRLAPELVPAVILAARLTAPANLRRAQAMLDGAFRTGPHPQIAAEALALTPGGAVERLRRARALAELASDHVESALTVSRAARAAGEFDLADATLTPWARSEPTQRVCAEMAEIAAARGEDGAVREWLARALRARRDPAWVADGRAAVDWDAISPVTGALDRFEWRVPDASEPPGITIDLSPSRTAGRPSVAHASATVPRVRAPPSHD